MFHRPAPTPTPRGPAGSASRSRQRRSGGDSASQSSQSRSRHTHSPTRGTPRSPNVEAQEEFVHDLKQKVYFLEMECQVLRTMPGGPPGGGGGAAAMGSMSLEQHIQQLRDKYSEQEQGYKTELSDASLQIADLRQQCDMSERALAEAQDNAEEHGAAETARATQAVRDMELEARRRLAVERRAADLEADLDAGRGEMAAEQTRHAAEVARLSAALEETTVRADAAETHVASGALLNESLQQRCGELEAAASASARSAAASGEKADAAVDEAAVLRDERNRLTQLLAASQRREEERNVQVRDCRWGWFVLEASGCRARLFRSVSSVEEGGVWGGARGVFGDVTQTVHSQVMV